MNENEEKAEVFNAAFASILNSHTSHPQCTQFPELDGRGRDLIEVPIIQEELVSNLLLHLEVYKSVWLDGLHPKVLKELA